MSAAIRWSGALLAVGALGVGASIALLAIRPDVNEALAPGLAWLLLGSTALMLLSLPAAYAVQADSAGPLGLVAHLLLEVGLLLLVLVAGLPLADPGFSGAYGENGAFFVLGIALTVGYALTGVSTLRAGVFPRPAGQLLLLGAAAFFFAFFVAELLPAGWLVASSIVLSILLAAGFLAMGMTMWQRPGR